MGARGIRCTICSLPKDVLLQVDSKLRAGIPQSRVATEYGLSVDSLGRHYRYGHHLVTKTVKKRRTAVKKPARQKDDLPVKYEPDGVLKSIQYVTSELEAMFDNQENDNKRLDVAKVIKGFHELSAKIEGLIKEGQVNILVSPGWLALQNDIIGALREYPEARAAVLERLRSHNAHNVEEAEFEVTT